MRQRLIGAGVLVPVVIVIFIAGQPFLWLGIALLAAAAAYETASLTRNAGLAASVPLSVAGAVLAAVGLSVSTLAGGDPFLLPAGYRFVAPGLAAWVIATAVVAFRAVDPQEGFRAWIGTLFASMYPGLLAFAGAITLLGPQPAGEFLGRTFAVGQIWLLILVLTVWALDSAAYLVGRSFPRGRFMNHISPKKTWSGVVGGTIAGIVVCAVLVAIFRSGNPLVGAALGLALAVAAQAGDLAESMLKRAASAKDSGTLIPGHGGILDRVDSFLFAAPVMFLALVIMSRSGVDI